MPPHAPTATLSPYTTLFRSKDRITARAIQVPAADFTVAAWFNWTTNPSPYYGGIQGSGCCSWELRVRADGRFGIDFYQSRSEEHTSELQSRRDLVCRLLLET